jgi:hypothetical protein
MGLASFEAIIRALAAAGVKYLVAGGLAVNAHGFLRQTKDADLVVQLVPDNIDALFTALASIGYRPIVPVDAAQFSDPELRGILVSQRNMKVLQFYSDLHRDTPVDVFAFEPFDFEAEYANAMLKSFSGATTVPFVSLRTLIQMKTDIGRAQDRIDVENLSLMLDDGERTS